ncbi:MAG TPA: substrate-binding domain-containing protein [Candidatus Limnocylindria bacterium]|nr:substrate-binding domain-containing protein [Candidatus Limnocylindria bacterium]
MPPNIRHPAKDLEFKEDTGMLRIARLISPILAALLVACTPAAPATQAPAAPATQAPATQAPATQAPATPAEAPRIGFSQANGSDVWRINQTNNVRDFCAEYMPGADVVVTDAQGDEAKQSADVDDLIAQGVDVLLLTPLSSAPLTPAAQRALDAGIPVITLDRSVETDVTQHIGADNKLIGRAAAEFVAETLLGGEGGRVLEIQGVIGASATTDRHDEFVAWLEENAPNVEIVGGSQTGEYRRENALVVMNDYLSTFGAGEADVVYTHNDEMALGAVQALETAGRLEEMAVVGVDGQNEAIDAIADGTIAATFTYDNAGKEACESAAALLDGETIDPLWVLETNQIDATNVEDWIGQGF